MTGALAASMSFSAFAEGESYEGVANSEVITIKKDVVTDGKTKAPNAAFTLDVAQGAAQSKVTLNKNKALQTDASKTLVEDYLDVQAGEMTVGNTNEAAFTVTDAAFGADYTTGTANTDGTFTYNSNFTITFKSAAFKNAGIYHYTVTESPKYKVSGESNYTDGTYAGMTYDSTTYDMYVFVENTTDNGLVVSHVVLANGNTKVGTLSNKYGAGESTDKVHDLTITKVVEGGLANMSEKFKFDVKIDSDIAGEKFNVYLVTKDGNGNEVETLVSEKTITGDANAVTTLENIENGTTYRIHGLTEGDVVSVYEQEQGKDGYVTTYTTTANPTTGNTTKTELSSQGTGENATYDTVKVSVNADGKNITIKNTRNAVTPTGVAMDIAPYALMVALAGGAAATFLRKKESFED